jgi:hypothetical protein
MEVSAGITHGGNFAVLSAPGIPTQFPVDGTSMVGLVGLHYEYPATAFTLKPYLPHYIYLTAPLVQNYSVFSVWPGLGYGTLIHCLHLPGSSCVNALD